VLETSPRGHKAHRHQKLLHDGKLVVVCLKIDGRQRVKSACSPSSSRICARGLCTLRVSLRRTTSPSPISARKPPPAGNTRPCTCTSSLSRLADAVRLLQVRCATPEVSADEKHAQRVGAECPNPSRRLGSLCVARRRCQMAFFLHIHCKSRRPERVARGALSPSAAVRAYRPNNH
jgi:hypothetical protein